MAPFVSEKHVVDNQESATVDTAGADAKLEFTSDLEKAKTNQSHYSQRERAVNSGDESESDASVGDGSLDSDSGGGGGVEKKLFQDDIPDGGVMAWLQVLGAFFCMFNSWGIINSFGVFQTYYTRVLLPDQTASTIAWIGSLQSFLLLFIGGIAGRLVDAGFFRHVLFSGTFLVTLGMMMTSLGNEYWHIMLAQGLVTGLGGGMAFLPAPMVANTWFSSKRAFAMGVGAAGSSIGGVIYPIVIRTLIDRVGFPWAVRVTAFIALGTLCVSCTVMRNRIPPRKGGALFDFSAFKDKKYAFFVVGSWFCFMGLWTPFFYIGGHALDNGISSDMSFYLLSIINASSTFGRLLPNFIADKVGPLNILIPCAGISSILIIILKYVTTQTGLIIYALAFGFASGSFVSLPPVAIAQITPDFSRLGTRIGQAFISCAFALLIGPPISGAIIAKDGGKLDGALVFSGVMGLVGVGIVSFARVAKTGWVFLAKA